MELLEMNPVSAFKPVRNDPAREVLTLAVMGSDPMVTIDEAKDGSGVMFDCHTRLAHSLLAFLDGIDLGEIDVLIILMRRLWQVLIPDDLRRTEQTCSGITQGSRYVPRNFMTGDPGIERENVVSHVNAGDDQGACG
jgi:hypothetical protein